MNVFERISKTTTSLYKTATLSGIIVLSFILSGCSDSKQETKYTIGFSQCVGSDLWRKTMLNEMQMQLSLYPGAEFIYYDANGDSKVQTKQVQDLLAQNIDILVISPNEAKPLTPVVEQAFSRGIPVIVIDRKTSSSLYTAYVGANNYEIGKMAGEYLGKTTKGSANVLEIMGLSGSSPAIERQSGFYDGIKNFPNIKIKAQIYGDWLQKNAKTGMLHNSANLKNIDAVFAHNDIMALGAKQIFTNPKLNLNANVKIIGVDAIAGEGGGMQMVYDKIINASLLYPTGGKEAIKTAFAILNKEYFEKENVLQTVVIDSSNVQLMKMQWNKINNQQLDIERQQELIDDQEKIYNSQRFILNIVVITLVLAVSLGGLAFHSLNENRKINKSLGQKNIEISDQRNQLVEMAVRAEVATEAKLNFFTNISHEFRTPLTLIMAPLEDLLGNGKTPFTAHNRLKLVYKNVVRLLRLVNQLIDYRKIEVDKMRVQASENDLIAFVKDILESFRDAAVSNNIALQLNTKEKELKMWFDEQLMDKVIFNLLSNAFKFTNKNGRIIVSIDKSEDDQKVFITVEDNGIGMTEETALHAFDLFYQADQSSFRGSGLGLSLSKELMQLHHGTITLKSNQWHGTVFTLSLPLGCDHLQKDEKINEKVKDEFLYENLRLFAEKIVEAPIQPDWSAFVKEKSVLIIDDNEDLLQYLTEKFSEHYEVFTANNGAAGLNQAYERVPDLIISDIVLPELSGSELTKQLKSDLRTSHIPIILLTAQVCVEQQIEGIKNMADAYILKPFNFDFLLETVHNLIRNRLLLKEHYISEFPLDNKTPISKKLDKKFLNDFAGIVENNLSNEKFAVEDICKNIGVSRVQLYRKVKALLGCSISDYILNRRLQKAKYLLINEDLSISEITYQVGFSSPTYFSTVFKSHCDLSPSEFKKSKMSLA